MATGSPWKSYLRGIARASIAGCFVSSTTSGRIDREAGGVAESRGCPAFTVALGAAQSLSRAGASPGNPAGPTASIAGENIIAFDLDRLFRGDRRPDGVIHYARAEAARILLTASSHRGMQPDDRTYLVRLVAGWHGPRRTSMRRALAHRQKG
jgi:hypothetical protein